MEVGLIGALAGLQPDDLLQGRWLFSQFLGAFTENFIAQELIAHFKKPLYYWTSKGQAEIDFLLEGKTEVVPLEVKAGPSIKSKSLQVFARQMGYSRLFRASLRNFARSGNVWNFPLYATANTLRFLDGR